MTKGYPCCAPCASLPYELCSNCQNDQSPPFLKVTVSGSFYNGPSGDCSSSENTSHIFRRVSPCFYQACKGTGGGGSEGGSMSISTVGVPAGKVKVAGNAAQDFFSTGCSFIVGRYNKPYSKIHDLPLDCMNYSDSDSYLSCYPPLGTTYPGPVTITVSVESWFSS